MAIIILDKFCKLKRGVIKYVIQISRVKTDTKSLQNITVAIKEVGRVMWKFKAKKLISTASEVLDTSFWVLHFM